MCTSKAPVTLHKRWRMAFIDITTVILQFVQDKCFVLPAGSPWLLYFRWSVFSCRLSRQCYSSDGEACSIGASAAKDWNTERVWIREGSQGENPVSPPANLDISYLIPVPLTCLNSGNLVQTFFKAWNLFFLGRVVLLLVSSVASP